MENFVDNLKSYFKHTSREKVLKDWEKSIEFDNNGPEILNIEEIKF